MKKRIFIPVSISFAILNTFLFSLTIMGLCAQIYCIKIYGFRHHDILSCIGILFILYESIRVLFLGKIHIKEKEIKVYSDLQPKSLRIQFKTVINYTDIKSIKIIDSTKNSKNKYAKVGKRSYSGIYKYLEFTLNNGRKKRIIINFYRKKQVIKLLSYISINMQYYNNQNLLDIDEIMKDWFIYSKTTKRKKKTTNDNDNVDKQ